MIILVVINVIPVHEFIWEYMNFFFLFIAPYLQTTHTQKLQVRSTLNYLCYIQYRHYLQYLGYLQSLKAT